MSLSSWRANRHAYDQCDIGMSRKHVFWRRDRNVKALITLHQREYTVAELFCARREAERLAAIFSLINFTLSFLAREAIQRLGCATFGMRRLGLRPTTSSGTRPATLNPAPSLIILKAICGALITKTTLKRIERDAFKIVNPRSLEFFIGAFGFSVTCHIAIRSILPATALSLGC